MITKLEASIDMLDRQKAISIPQTSEQAKNAWGRLKRKQKIRDILECEQKGLCGYTEFNIEDFRSRATLSTHSKGCHIEHIKPKSIFPQETFDYQNLLLSILDSDDLQWFKEDSFIDNFPESDNSHREFFGGAAKENDYDGGLFISPINNTCNYFFTFLEDSGKIVPAPHIGANDRDKVTYTIDLLNLNHPYLKNQRRKRMKEVLDDIDGLGDINIMQRIIDEEISEDGNNQIASFPSAVSSLINRQ